MSTDCHAGGISMRMACIGSRPPTSSSSSMLSSDWESEPGERDHRQHVAQIRQQRRAEQRAARHRPGAIALHGVDLAVVGEIAVRMREAPLRQRIRGEALVEHRHRGLHARILEVRIELRQELRHHHALVDDGARRQGRDVERRIVAARAASRRGGAPCRACRLKVASSMSAAELTKICSMRGSVLSASAPQADGSTLAAPGIRRPRNFSRSISAQSTRRASAALAGSRFRNTRPAANCGRSVRPASAADGAQEAGRHLDAAARSRRRSCRRRRPRRGASGDSTS